MSDMWEYDGTEEVPKDVTVVVVKEGVKFIPRYSFVDCRQLVSISIPDSVEFIMQAAFRGCTSLRSINLPLNLHTIYEFAFFQCKSLISVGEMLPRSRLVKIGEWAFYECASLASIEFPSTLNTIGRCAFYGCSSIKTLKLPPMRALGDKCFCNCESLTAIQLPTVGDDYWIMFDHTSFHGCKSLLSLRFYLPITEMFMSFHIFFLVNMIQSFPAIAQNPCTEKNVLPLHLILMYGYGNEFECIPIILNAAPKALSVPDPKYHMYPFILAACYPEVTNDEDRKSHNDEFELGLFNCSYMLLRGAPWVIHFLLPKEIHKFSLTRNIKKVNKLFKKMYTNN